MPIVEIYGSANQPFQQSAAGALVVTGTILNLSGAYTGDLPVTGTVAVNNFPAFPTGYLVRQGASTALASVGAVIKATAGRVGIVSVIVSGAIGAIHDTKAAVSASASNQVAVILGGIGITNLQGFPCSQGICYVAGAAQTASISYE